MQGAAALPPGNPVLELTGELLTSALITAHCDSPSQDQTLLGSHVIPSSLFPSCFDKAGETLELISYVKYNLLSMHSFIPGEYLLISSIFSVQTFLKAVPHFLKHLCH